MGRRVAVLAMLVACGDNAPTAPDAPIVADAQPDALVFPACREFLVASSHALPARVTGSLTGADVQSPTQCNKVDAPYGIASSGPDSVIALTGLVPGTAYIIELQSAADLAFYVANGCSTMSGPAASECALFVDASAGTEEVGRFVASASTAYVVIDHYQSATPANQNYTLDVYAEACQDDSACTSGPPVCYHGRCVQCADSFDCPVMASPRCESATNTCGPGADQCTADDASEPGDDGPAGAVTLTPDAGGAISASGQICSAPRTEVDYFKLEVAAGETWDFSLTWTGGRDLDLEVLGATGTDIGLSFWEQPETMRLAYLPAGTYYVRVTDFSPSTTAPIAYTLTGQRISSVGCSTPADCAANFRNQVHRGECASGACVDIVATNRAAGEACDNESDCADDLACPDFYFVANADTRSVCAPHCTSDSQCAALGAGADYVCTTYLATENFCVQKCQTDDECPTDPSSEPLVGPWYRLTCQTSTGRCVFQ